MSIIEIDNLVKRYKGLTAVDHLSLSVPAGAIYGFVGPNGAGKTSTMRILTTLMEATSGDARIAGYSVTKNPRDVRRAIGYMPDFFGVYNDMTVWEYLDFFSACYDIDANERAVINRDLLELVDLPHKRDAMVDSLSRGMKQRLALARTLAHDPQVLILDEPASGLDPRARVEIRELLVELARMGKTIFFSTHILADVAEICSDIGIVEAGKLVTSGGVADMQRALVPTRQYQLRLLEADFAAAQTTVGQQTHVAAVQRATDDQGELTSTLLIDFTGDDAAASALLIALVQAGLPILEFSETAHDMEDLFMRATRGIVN